MRRPSELQDNSRQHSLRLLEVAAMPFPSSQGTQALLREQCDALARRGHDVHLLVYGYGGEGTQVPFTIHRIPDWPRERSLRSGPSWSKIVLDLSLIWAVRKLSNRLRPDVIHAHNYEALVACLCAYPSVPVVYHAHTLFEHELPTFAQGKLATAFATILGAVTDRFFPPRAALTLAVSPRLVRELLCHGHPAERLLCSLPGIDIPEFASDFVATRRLLGLEDAEVVGYCGNLDGYQGLSTMLDAVALVALARPKLRLLVVTSSSPERLRDEAHRRGLGDRLRIVNHGDFPQALAYISAAHVCLVPRSAPGGFPIKLLTYMAAGRPVVATRAGSADLELGDSVSIVDDNDPRAMAESIHWLLSRPLEAERRGEQGHIMATQQFSWGICAAELERQLCQLVRNQVD